MFFQDKIDEVSHSLSPNFRKLTKIRFEVSDEDRFKFLRKGYWHSHLIGKSGAKFIGLRLRPERQYKAWDAIKIYDFYKAITVAPNLDNFLFMIHFDNIQHQRVFDLIKTNIKNIEEDLNILHTAFGGDGTSPDLTAFFEQYDFEDFRDKEDLFKKMLLFCQEKKAKDYIELLEQILEKESFFPGSDHLDGLELFNTRIRHILAFKSANEYFKGTTPKNLLYDHFWNSFEGSHSHDFESLVYKFLASQSDRMELEITSYTNILALQEFEVKDIHRPLFAAALNLFHN